MPKLDPLVTEAQERMRDLVIALSKSERPLTSDDLRQLQPFVEVVRSETVESDHSIRRVDYYVLNDLGRALLHKWATGKLDHHFSADAALSRSLLERRRS